VGRFALLPAAAALAGALLLQIGVNLANDYFDFVKGVDTPRRVGPKRVTQSGLIPPARVRLAMIAALMLSALPGAYLIRIGGVPILLIGIAGILAALAYSGGPSPLASRGLGDAVVFIFFGPIAVCGTYYVQAFSLPPLVATLSFQMGFLVTAVLTVNNLRDIRTDREAGKVTLAVLLGQRGACLEYRFLILAAYALCLVQWVAGWVTAWGLLPLGVFPLALRMMRSVRHETPAPDLNHWLGRTAGHSLAFGIVASIGLILS
jgi:1,4-dihydroxy-2-naphthoate octaprenyltransferase